MRTKEVVEITMEDGRIYHIDRVKFAKKLAKILASEKWIDGEPFTDRYKENGITDNFTDRYNYQFQRIMGDDKQIKYTIFDQQHDWKKLNPRLARIEWRNIFSVMATEVKFIFVEDVKDDEYMV